MHLHVNPHLLVTLFAAFYLYQAELGHAEDRPSFNLERICYACYAISCLYHILVYGLTRTTFFIDTHSLLNVFVVKCYAAYILPVQALRLYVFISAFFYTIQLFVIFFALVCRTMSQFGI